MNAHTTTVELPAMRRSAEVRATSYSEVDNTIDVIWTTGAKVRRRDWDDGPYDEELIVSASAVRLDRLNAGAPFLNTHGSYDLSDVIGSVVPGSATIRAGKGYATIKLSDAVADADVVGKIRSGVIRNISVGYRIHRVEKTEGQDAALWRVVDWEPMEISAVPIPADPGAQVRSEKDDETFPCLMSRAAGTTTNATRPKGGHSMSEIRDTTDIDETDETNEVSVRAERKRVSEILALATRFNERELGDHHIAAGSPVRVFREDLINKRYEDQQRQFPNGINSSIGLDPYTGLAPRTGLARNGVYGPANAEKRGEAIAAALLHRYDAGKYQLTDDARSFRGQTLMEIGRACLEAEGVRTDGLGRLEIAQRALGAATRSGGMMSTSDFPNILANVANKTLRDAYEAAPQTFRPIVRETTVPDFKEVSRNQLGEAPQLEKVNEHGEFKRGSMGEAVEKYQVSTFGKVVAITRQVLINDDLNAFTRLPMAFGIQAANLESDLVWAQILSNPTMGDGNPLFHAKHGNLTAAAGISIDSIAAGRELMRLQKGLDGVTSLNITPGFLITSVAAETKAAQLLTQITPAQIANAVPGYMKLLTAISEPRLDNGFVNPANGQAVAGSRFAWYLAAAPGAIDTVELAYLEGNRGVYTETRTGFDIDGVEVKVRMDVGAKTIDWRGLLKNPATAL